MDILKSTRSPISAKRKRSRPPIEILEPVPSHSGSRSKKIKTEPRSSIEGTVTPSNVLSPTEASIESSSSSSSSLSSSSSSSSCSSSSPSCSSSSAEEASEPDSESDSESSSSSESTSNDSEPSPDPPSFASASSESNAESSGEPDSESSSSSSSSSESASSSIDRNPASNSHPLASPFYLNSVSDVNLASSDLQSRLSSFLPTLAAANEELDALRQEGRLGERNMEKLSDDDNNDEDEEERDSYIEMNLGLGVLEEKRDGEESDTSGESSDTELGDDGEVEDRGRRAVLRKLMRNQKVKRTPGIEVVE